MVPASGRYKHLTERKINMQIKYVHKMGNEDKPFMIFEKDDVPEDILKIISENQFFKKSTAFGQKGLGDPEQMEILIISDKGIEKTFQYFNRAIHYMIMGDNSLQPVFKVFTYFMMKERGR